MKNFTPVSRIIRTTALALALLGGVLIVSPAYAQYKPTGDDGITASPRLRQQLNERKAPAIKIAATATMACAKCKDTWVSRPITDTKGVGSRAMTGNTTKLVPKHLCDGCGTEWKVAGTGKAKEMVATHTCTECGSDNMACCTGAKPTKGMQKVNVAPVK